ncbi:MAG: ABC transporter permease subunit [bacterium]|nr:ABC transporter permease subunit [bacterium]
MWKQIWIKEIRAGLYTWKNMVWLLIASILFSFTSYLLLTDKELSLLDQTELMWMLGQVIAGVGLLVVILDASLIITSEFEMETAESLFLAPIRLSEIILGKLLASLTLWLLVFIVAVPYIFVASAGTRLLMPYLIYMFFLGTLGIAGFIMLVFAVSLLFRSSKNTLSTSLVILLMLAVPALFSSTLKNNSAAAFLSKINPVDNIFGSLDNVLVDFQLSFIQNWKFILPLACFVILMFGFMFLSMRIFRKKGVLFQSV